MYCQMTFEMICLCAVVVVVRENLLSIPGKGSGCAPSCCSRANSMSNLTLVTLATTSCILKTLKFVTKHTKTGSPSFTFRLLLSRVKAATRVDERNFKYQDILNVYHKLLSIGLSTASNISQEDYFLSIT